MQSNFSIQIELAILFTKIHTLRGIFAVQTVRNYHASKWYALKLCLTDNLSLLMEILSKRTKVLYMIHNLFKFISIDNSIIYAITASNIDSI